MEALRATDKEGGQRIQPLTNLEIGWLNGWIYSATLLVISSSAYVFAKRMTSFSWMTQKQFLLAGIADVATIGLCIFTIWKPKVFRHPYYLGGYLSLVGIGLICREWLIISVAMASMIPGFWSAKWEEEHLEETYGDEYIEYKRRR